MAEPGARRKLSAILSADVVGYSRLMAADEAATVETLKSYRAAIGRIVARHLGRVVNTPGDALLAEFPSAVEAVQAAVELQHSIEGRNQELAPDRRMHFRVGVNLGDVIEEADGTIYGDGVNIAARMEALAEGGGICIASTVYDAVEGKLSFGFDFLGEQQVKNIAKPVKVYRVRAEARPAQPKPWRARPVPIGVAAALLLALAAVGVWLYRDLVAPAEIAEVEDTVLALPKGPSIAVLPFANLSGDPEQEYFVDGLTEEIITGLTRSKELFVIGRNSTFQYKGQAVDVRKVGEDLGVRYVVEGSVRKSADSIRVTAQLLDATTGGHLWAETYDRDLTASNLFALQDEITGRVVANIADLSGGVLSRTLVAASITKAPETLEAYECVLRYFHYLNVLSPEEHRRVRDCLQSAVERDPSYARAWAALAYLYSEEHFLGFNPGPKPLDRALEAATRAVELDSADQYAHDALATVYFMRHDLEAFFAEADRTIALNPNNATVLANMGNWLAYAGQWQRGVALLKKAQALNPRHPGWYYLVFFFDQYRKGEYAAALDLARQVNMPDFWHAHAVLALANAQLGRAEEARTALARAGELNPDFIADPRKYYRARNFAPELIEHVMDGLRKAGLEIPAETH